MSPAIDNVMSTPPEVAKRLRVKPSKVIAWIYSGELRAVNVATLGCQRPRWRIDPIDLENFLRQRSAGSTPTVTRRRRKKDDGVIQFY